jgi:hypothetical protein
MELELHRLDLLQTSAAAAGTLLVSSSGLCKLLTCSQQLTHACCKPPWVMHKRVVLMVVALQVLPPGENKTQKVAVGDMSGVVQCFSVKKGEVIVSFKSLPGPQKVGAKDGLLQAVVASLA